MPKIVRDTFKSFVICHFLIIANAAAKCSVGLKNEKFSISTKRAKATNLWFKFNNQNRQIGDLAVGEVETLIYH